MGSKGSSTTTSSNAPPPEFTAAFQAANQRATGVANTPYQNYPGQLVAGFSPGQVAGLNSIDQLTANGGVAAPYLQAAQQNFTSATQPLLPTIPTVDNSLLTGLAPSAFGLIGQEATGLSPANIQKYENPWTQQVVDATQAQFNNQNAQTAQRVAGSATQQGAYGGDREAVAQAITAGQEQQAQAPVIAGLESQGYLTGMQGAQTQAQLEGQAAQQELSGLSQQQQLELGAEEANRWLASQAAFGMAGLGSEAQQTGMQGAQAQLQGGSLEQQLAQQYLNVPYQQFVAQQAYPYQTTGWLANIAEGLGGASGGSSSTTSPGPSTASQVGGLATGALGLAGATGGFGQNGWLSGLFGGSSGGQQYDYGTWSSGGGIPHRAPGGMIPGGMMPPVSSDVPDISLSVVPGSTGMGSAPASHGTANILKNYGMTSTTTGGDSVLGGLLKTAGSIAAGIYGGPAGAIAANAVGSQVHFADGGGIEHRAIGGMSSSEESPWWTRASERQSERHGLLASPVAGRTDQLAISPASGSYVIPADVVSGLGEGNTLAGANVMQRILETGPHGIPLPRSVREKGPPQPPPAYRESGGGMASGGEVPHRAAGGLNPAVSDYLATVQAPSGTIGATRAGVAGGTGIPALDAYLSSTQAGASHAAPIVFRSAPVVAPTMAAPSAMAPYDASSATSSEGGGGDGGGGGMRGGGRLVGRAEGGMTPEDQDVSPYPGSGGDSEGAVAPAMPSADASAMQPVEPTPVSAPVIETGLSPMVSASEPSVPVAGNASTPKERIHTAKADPWLALAEAGFGAAAGRSPFAMENIGGGAYQGVKSYIQQKQQAEKENLNADIWSGRLGVQQQRADTYKDRVAAMTAIQTRTNELKLLGLQEKTARDQAMMELGQGKLDASIDRYRTQAQQRDRSLDQGDRRLEQGDTRLTQRATQIQGTQEYRDAQIALRQRLGDVASANNVMARAVQLSAATGIPLSKSVDQIIAQQPRTRSAAQVVTAPPVISPPPASGRPPLAGLLPP